MGILDDLRQKAFEQAPPEAPETPAMPTEPTSGLNPYREAAQQMQLDALGAERAEVAQAINDENERQQLGWKLVSQNLTPETAAKIRALSEQTGKPLYDASQEFANDLIGNADLRTMMDIALNNRGIYTALMENAISVPEFYQDTAKLTVAETMFGLMKHVSGNLDFSDLGWAFGSSATSTTSSQIGGIPVLGGALERTGERRQAETTAMQEHLRSLGVGTVGVPAQSVAPLADHSFADALQSATDLVTPHVDKWAADMAARVENPNLATDVAGGFGSFASIALTFYLTGGAGSTAGMLSLGADQQADLIEQTRQRLANTDYDEATRASIEAGLLGEKPDGGEYTAEEDLAIIAAAIGEATLEKIAGVGVILKAIPNKTRSTLVRILLSSGAEAATEGLQSIWQKFVARETYAPDIDITEGAAYEALIGGIVGGGVSVFTGGGDVPVDPTSRQATLEAQLETINSQVEALQATRLAVEESQTFQMDPIAMRSVLENSGDQIVSLPADEVNALYQGGFISPQDLEALQVTDNLQQMADIGADIEVPASVLLTLPDSDFDAMMPHVRVQPDQPTQAEVTQNLKDQDAEMARLTAELQATLESDLEGVDKTIRVAEEVKATAPVLKSQIMDSLGLPEGEASAHAMHIANRYAVRADDMEGVTALQLIEEDALTFQRGAAPTQPVVEQYINIPETPQFIEWAGTSDPVVNAREVNSYTFKGDGPFVMEAYHGTTHEFTEFDSSKFGTAEGHFGRMNYFTSDPLDAASNYGGTGPDLTGRIERLAERYENELFDDPEAFGRTFEEVENDNERMDLARELATEKLQGDTPRTFAVYLRTEKPFIVGGAGRFKYIEFTDFAALDAQAVQEVADAYGVTPEEINAQRDTFEDQIFETRDQLQGDEPNALIEAVETVASRYEGVNTSEVLETLYEVSLDGTTHSRLEALLRESEGLQYAEDPETGDLVIGQVIAEVIQELGFDSIILQNADQQFNMNMDAPTAHIQIFDENNVNIKSRDANRGTFDRTSPNIYEQPALDLFDTPLPIEGRTTIKKLGEALTERHQNLVGRQLFPEESETDFNIVVDSAVKEVAAQIARPNSGLGWYSKDVDTALHDTARIFPSLLENEGDRNLFLTFAGIFSSGMDPDQAWMTAALAFEGYLASGQIPLTRSEAATMAGRPIEFSTFKDRKTGADVTKEKGWGVRAAENTKALTAFKYLADREGGVEAAARWIMERQERSAINEVMIESGAYKSGRFKTVKERAGDPEFGALIFGPKLGRYTIGLFGVPVRAEDTTIDLWYTRTFRRLTGRLLEGPLSKEGVAGEPANDTERATVFRLTGAIADKFNITNGDAQALLWFFEKRLYGEHGVTIKEGTNSDGAKRLAEARGLAPYDGRGGVQPAGEPRTDVAAAADNDGGVRGAPVGRATFRGHAVTALKTYGGSRPVVEIAEGDVFRDLISRAQDELGDIGAQVTVYDNYDDARTFIFDDGYSGFALMDGDIISVFSVPRKAKTGAVKRVMEVAIAEGGYRLDAFDTFLPRLYARQGFRAVAKLPFNREYAPEGWNYELFAEKFPHTKGEPDVKFMIYDPANASPDTDNVVSDYDAGTAAQGESAFILEQGPRGAYLPPSSANQSNLIWLSEQADLSTLLHETGHMFLFQMVADATDSRLKEAAAPKYKQMLEGTRSWFGQNAAQAKKDLSRMRKELKHRAKDETDPRRAAMLETRLDALDRVAEKVKDDTGYLKAAGEAFMAPEMEGYDADAEILFHELWARGYERYLSEGVAPSKSLKRAFQKFSSWLISVYRQMANLNVTLSPEIRDVFDRLLATEEAIARETTSPTYKIPSEILEFATATEARKLAQLVDDAELEARAQMQARQSKAFQKDERAKRAARRAELTEEITKQVRQEPVYAAARIAREGVMPDGQEIGSKPMDLAEVTAIIGAERAEALPVGVATKGNKKGAAIPVSDVAALSGYASEQEMLDALTAPHPSEERTIEQQVDDQLNLELGAAATEATLAEDAAASAQNDKFADLQALQVRILKRMASTEVEKVARREVETEGAPSVETDRAAQAEAAAKTGPEAALARVKADVQRKVNIGHRRAQRAGKQAVRAIRRGIDPVAVNAAADAFVDQMEVGKATPARYRQTADRLSAKIEKAIAARDYAEAANLMEQRALVLAVSKRVAEFQSKSQKQIKSYREFTGRSDKKLANGYDIDYVNAIRAALSPFDLGRSSPMNYDADKALAALETTEPSLYNEITRTIEVWRARGGAMTGADKYRQLTVAEFKDVIQMADMLKANARSAAGVLVEGRRVRHDLIAAEIDRNADNMRGVEKREARKPQFRGSEWRRWLTTQRNTVRGSLRIVGSWVRMADRDNTLGPLTTHLLRPIMDATTAYYDNRGKPQELLLEAVLGRADLAAKVEIAAPELDGWTFQSKGELIHFLLHMGNESNKAKLLNGGAIDIETGQHYVWGAKNEDGTVDDTRANAFLDRMYEEGTITKADVDLVQAIWGIFEITKAPAQAAHKRMYGYNFTEVETTPFVTPFGTYAGGYVPAILDPMMSDRAAQREAEMISSTQPNTYMFPTVERGFTKSRVEGAFGPMKLDLTSIPSHFDRVMKFAYLAPTVRDAARLVTNPAVSKAINRISPAYVQQGIIPWLQTVASQQVTTPAQKGDWISRGMTTLSRRVGLHLMMGNVVNAAEQVSGFAPAVVRVGAGNLAKAMTRWRVDGQSARKYVVTRSKDMEQRLLNSTNEAMHTTIDILTDKGKINKAEIFSAKYGYFLQQTVQNVMDPVVWLAAEQKAMKTVYPDAYAKELALSGDEAIAAEKADAAVVFFADQVVRETQASMRAGDIANINVGSGSKRLFLKFFQWFSAMSNLLGTEHQIAWNNQNINWGRKMGRSFYAYLMVFASTMVISEALRMALSGELDDLDDEDDMQAAMTELFIGSQVKGAFAMIPYVGPVASAAYGTVFTKEVYDNRINIGAPIGITERSVTGIARMVQAAVDPDVDFDTRQSVRAMLDTFALTTGLPTNAFSKPISYAIKVQEGEADPEGLVDVIQGAITGRDGTEN